MREGYRMEYWELTENPSGEIYKKLIDALCTYSDKFYFITRKELRYNQQVLAEFEPYTIEIYITKKWTN